MIPKKPTTFLSNQISRVALSHVTPPHILQKYVYKIVDNLIIFNIIRPLQLKTENYQFWSQRPLKNESQNTASINGTVAVSINKVLQYQNIRLEKTGVSQLCKIPNIFTHCVQMYYQIVVAE
ncbi:Hypothetical_protein [Hexamita inflata]|uniref:Hypothetical_protein n=1 Tax=Hexamita inflata TaxID=28002 RepID=A0AA86RD20_9EUKA|nr:Hypothetical protein HINF_LOCUS63336 [Hexamita inflata]